MKTALLVVDMQKEFFQEAKSRDGLMEALAYVNYAIGVFREAECPVIFIQDKDASGEGFELYEELYVQEDDIRISKTHCNSFWNTPLEEELHKLGVEMVVVCGYAAEYCVYGTYNGAMERGFEPAILQHGIASAEPKYAAFIQDVSRTVSIMTLKYFLKNDRR